MNADNLEKQKWQTAIHEAGHAVVGRVLGIRCGYVTITADAESSGHSITPDIWDIMGDWEAHGLFRRSERSAYIARIVTFMAGTQAVLQLKPEDDIDLGDDNDRYQVMCMLDSEGLMSREDRLTRMTRQIVQRHWAKIEAVARKLLESRSLESNEVDQLLATSMGKRENMGFEGPSKGDSTA